MSLEPEPARHLWLIVLVLGLIGLTIVLMTAPAQELLGGSAEAIRGAHTEFLAQTKADPISGQSLNKEICVRVYRA